jgi:hypothetical protein
VLLELRMKLLGLPLELLRLPLELLGLPLELLGLPLELLELPLKWGSLGPPVVLLRTRFRTWSGTVAVEAICQDSFHIA